MHTAYVSLTPSESPSPHLRCLRDCFLYHLHHLLYLCGCQSYHSQQQTISHHRKEICLIFKYRGATGKTLTKMANRAQHLIPTCSSPSGSQVSEPFVALLGCRAVSFRGRETHAKEISFVSLCMAVHMPNQSICRTFHTSLLLLITHSYATGGTILGVSPGYF